MVLLLLPFGSINIQIPIIYKKKKETDFFVLIGKQKKIVVFYGTCFPIFLCACAYLISATVIKNEVEKVQSTICTVLYM